MVSMKWLDDLIKLGIDLENAGLSSYTLNHDGLTLNLTNPYGAKYPSASSNNSGRWYINDTTTNPYQWYTNDIKVPPDSDIGIRYLPGVLGELNLDLSKLSRATIQAMLEALIEHGLVFCTKEGKWVESTETEEEPRCACGFCLRPANEDIIFPHCAYIYTSKLLGLL